MTHEIPKYKWLIFFDDLTKRRFEWLTKIEVINEEIGSQILENGLPLQGITAEIMSEEKSVVEIIVGQDRKHHQTHNIKNPTMVAYLSEDDNPGEIVEIEEADGTKTLIHIMQPMPLAADYSESREMKAA